MAVKYSVTPSLTLDLTYNTDFAQVEADNVQINLTRFGLFYPEKREFFLERSDLFQFGNSRSTEVFFSRRIGLTNDILGGGGFSSRIMTGIRSDEGLAYSAGSSFGLGTYYDGVFRAAFQSRSETVARASAIVMEEIDRIRSTLVTEEELGNSIASFVETFTRNFSSAASSRFSPTTSTGPNPRRCFTSPR